MTNFISEYFSSFKTDVAPAADVTGAASQGPSRPPAVMGILNVTPDSFSDGGSFQTPASAIEVGMRMVAAGAEIIDVGGESTRPGFTEVDAETETARILPVVEGLAKEGVLVSIDTHHAPVAKAALAAGAQIINDVDGFRDVQMAELAASAQCGCIVMSDAKTAAGIHSFWQAQTELLRTAGVEPSCIMVDPGFGFGKDIDDNFALMQELPQLIEGTPYPVLVGVSRKRFIGGLSAEATAQKRDAATLGVDLLAVKAGASVLRVHDVPETIAGLSTFWPLSHPTPRRALIALGSEVGACKNGEDFKREDFLGKSFDEIQFAANLHCLNEALEKISALPFTKVKRVSGVYETEGALGVEATVLNIVLEIETNLLPFILLKHLLAIEKDLGRGRPEPRTMDCDLLWVENVVCQSPTLTLPHPGMGKRHFVLRPLVDVMGPPCHFLNDIHVELAPKEERIGPILRKLKTELTIN